MKYRSVRVLAFCLLVSPLALQAQTWVGGTAGNTNGFGVAGNWSPSGVPTSNGSTTNLFFGSSSFPSVTFNTGAFSAASLTFGGTAPKYTLNGSGNTLSIGTGGVTTVSGSLGVDISSSLQIALLANQTWTTASGGNVSHNGNLSGGFSLTKAGTGYLVLSGNNSFTGGLAVNAGAVYLGTSNSGMTGAVSVGSGGTLGGAFGDLTLSNAVTLTSGATLGGSPQGNGSSMELTGAVTLDNVSHTLNLGSKSDVFFGGSLGAAGSTDLTVAGDGTSIAILGGTISNIDSITANNAAIAFGNTSVLPTTIHATNGGYVSVADLGGSTPGTTAVLDLIANRATFNGILGFDTDEEAAHPHVYSGNIDLTGFTNGNVRLGSLTSATLTGTITPVGQSYDFGGFAAQDGLLAVKSNLGELNTTTTSVSLVSSAASGGAAQNGMVLALMGTNTFSGDISVTYSSLLLDSAISGTTDISLGAFSYAGYTENAGFADFAAFSSRVTSSTTTSILGIDSGAVVNAYVNTGAPSARTVTDAIDLSGFSSINLGTLTGATVTGTITAPSDGVIRLVNLGGEFDFVINTTLNQSNGLIVGMNGSEGAVVLSNNNTFSGNTLLAGGQLLVGNGTTSALSSGTLSVSAPTAGDLSVLGAASGNASLANNITVTGTTLRVGTGGEDENTGNFLAGTSSLTLNGVIGGTGGLEITGLTTLSGANTYAGGTTIRADTTVSNNTGLSTGPVFVGYSDNDGTPVKSTLAFTTTAPSIGYLSDASLISFNGGSGNINMTGASPTLTINQQNGPSPTGTFSGQFLGNAVAIVKSGTAQLALTGANSGQISSITINAGSVAIGDSQATTATFNGNVTLAGGGLFFRPGSGQTLAYNGSINSTGAGGVTINGHGTGITNITGGSSTFTGSTNINSGTLRISADNAWSSASATTVNAGTTLDLQANQTVRNLAGTGTVSVASGKTITVNNAANTTFSGGITGAGALTKTGSSSLTLSHISANTYTGATLVSGGTLIVNGALGSSSVTVNSGAFLQGTGTLNDVFMNGTYQPGTAANTAGVGTLDSLTMSSTGLLHMEIGGTGQGSSYDYLNISGAFTADGTLSVTFFNGYNPGTAVSFNLFDFTSASGGFDTFNLPTLTSGLSWDTSALLTTGMLSVTGTAVPEPSTYAAVAGLAALGLAAWRRRSARAVQVTTRL